MNDLVEQLHREMAIPIRLDRLASKERAVAGITEYFCDKRIASGTFGDVYHCTIASTGKSAVAKVMENTSANAITRELVEMEVLCMRHLRHFACVELIESFRLEHDVVVLVLEFMPRGNLGRFIRRLRKSQQFLSDDHLEQIMSPLLLGLHYIHNRKLLHRDIKPRNILIDEFNIPKIGDFGCGKIIADGSHTAKTVVGTQEIRAPERWKEGGERTYGPPADVWSLGVVFYKLTELCAPFAPGLTGDEEMVTSHSDEDERQVVDAQPQDDPELRHGILYVPVRPMIGPASDDIKAVVMKMLTKDPNARTTMQHMMQLPFVRGMLQRYAAYIAEKEGLPDSYRNHIVSAVRSTLEDSKEVNQAVPRIGHVSVKDAVALMTVNGYYSYTLGVEGHRYALVPSVEGGGQTFEGHLGCCSVALSGPTFLVLQTPQASVTLCTAGAAQWVTLLSALAKEAYSFSKNN